MAFLCSKTILLLLSLLSVGLVAAASGLFLYFIVTYKINEIVEDGPLLWGTIIVLVASVFILIFSIIASCSESGCLGFLLGIVFLVFAAAIVGLFVCLIIFNEKIWETIGKAWTSDKADIKEAIHELEKTFNCSSWDNSTVPVEDTCRNLIEGKYNEYKIFVFIGLGVAALLLLVGVVLSFCKICQKDYEPIDERKNTAEQPLSYGW